MDDCLCDPRLSDHGSQSENLLFPMEGPNKDQVFDWFDEFDFCIALSDRKERPRLAHKPSDFFVVSPDRNSDNADPSFTQILFSTATSFVAP